MDLEDLYRLLRAGHIQAQGIVDTLREPLLVLDKNQNVLSGNSAFFETFSVSKDDTIGHSLFSLGNGQWNIPELRKLLSEVVPKSAAIVGFEVRHDFPVLGRRTVLVSARRLVHPDSSNTSVLVVFEDVTDRRRSEASKDILLAETRHRMRNLMATVRALANRTTTEGRSAREYRDAFLGRFAALAEAQDLALSGRTTADFSDIMARAAKLAPSDDTFTRRGPPVTVTAPKLLPLSLLAHELTTNALKHGALSAADGTVTVEWSIEEQPGGGRRLLIDWRESNGPRVNRPTRSGFGSELIEYSVKHDLSGTAEMSFEPGGFHGRFTVPLDQRPPNQDKESG